MNKKSKPELIIIGGGLAGSEAAWQAAQRGLRVHLFEMRPIITTGAHVSDHLAELVCSNSLGTRLSNKAGGILKNELNLLGSLLMICAKRNSVPAGSALAVDREEFSRDVTNVITRHPNIRVIREEVKEIPSGLTIIASGPLTSHDLSQKIMKLTGREHLFFYDAIAPIILSESINMNTAYRASRYNRGESEDGDYINCPLSKDEYDKFVDALLQGERIELKAFEREIEKGVRAGADKYFEGCLPIEILAGRGRNTLAFGPMRPVGLHNPANDKRPYAVLQLRQDNLADSLYNMVGFQTNLKFQEQRKIFRLIPGLENAQFARYGQMHRNTFVYSPEMLIPSLQTRFRDDLFFAGQITGIEGYAGNIATGLLAGWNAARLYSGKDPLVLPATTMIGALLTYSKQTSAENFQPMKANLGILPPLVEENLSGGRNKRIRAQLYANRANNDMISFLSINNLL